MDFTLVSPATWTGMEESAFVPSPSCPTWLLPQDQTVPSPLRGPNRMRPSVAGMMICPLVLRVWQIATVRLGARGSRQEQPT